MAVAVKEGLQVLEGGPTGDGHTWLVRVILLGSTASMPSDFHCKSRDSVIFWGLGIEIHIERVQTLQIGLKSRFEATKLILVPDIFIQVEGSSYS